MKFKIIIVLSTIIFLFNNILFSQTKKIVSTKKQDVTVQKPVKKLSENLQKPKITFVELGSINCIPCRMMQPVMKEIEKEYKGIVDVIFYDVWTKEGAPYAKKYNIRAIPTQVFLDENGTEFFRHEGFFPKENLKKVLDEKLNKIIQR